MARPDWASDPEATDSEWDLDPNHFDHRRCTPRCAELATPSPLVRERPPNVRCDFCGAPAFVACHLTSKTRLPLTRWGNCHPSRLEKAAAA